MFFAFFLCVLMVKVNWTTSVEPLRSIDEFYAPKMVHLSEKIDTLYVFTLDHI